MDTKPDFKLALYGLLFIGLALLVVSAARASQPEVGERWRAVITLFVVISGMLTAAWAGWQTVAKLRERMLARRTRVVQTQGMIEFSRFAAAVTRQKDSEEITSPSDAPDFPRADIPRPTL